MLRSWSAKLIQKSRNCKTKRAKRSIWDFKIKVSTFLDLEEFCLRDPGPEQILAFLAVEENNEYRKLARCKVMIDMLNSGKLQDKDGQACVTALLGEVRGTWSTTQQLTNWFSSMPSPKHCCRTLFQKYSRALMSLICTMESYLDSCPNCSIWSTKQT